MALKKKHLGRYVADIVGMTVFVIGAGALAAGEYTELLKWTGEGHGGINFLRQYIDYPFYDLISGMIPERRDSTYTITIAVLIHGIVSTIYGIFGYLLGKLVGSL